MVYCLNCIHYEEVSICNEPSNVYKNPTGRKEIHQYSWEINKDYNCPNYKKKWWLIWL
jgi:hypothetical protein